MFLKLLLISRTFSCAQVFSKSSFKTMSLSPKTSQACADVYLIPMFGDNYGYLLVDRETNLAATVDPGEPQPVLDAISSINCKITTVLCTHKHDDHSGGNERFKAEFPEIEIIATKYEDIPAATKLVGEGDQFNLGKLRIDVLYTPCHTRGHVVYVVSGDSGKPIIFSGDTLFVGGCGRFFEGTATEMLNNMDRLSQQQRDSLVFCAHEYTESNYRFLNSINPELCGERYKTIQEMRGQKIPTVPTTIGEEIDSNLFMHCRTEDLQTKLGCTTPEETMAKLRELKNEFK